MSKHKMLWGHECPAYHGLIARNGGLYIVLEDSISGWRKRRSECESQLTKAKYFVEKHLLVDIIGFDITLTGRGKNQESWETAIMDINDKELYDIPLTVAFIPRLEPQNYSHADIPEFNNKVYKWP